MDRNYPVYINGKYQGPDPSGGGWLIGVSTNINPGQKYRYELLILDCGKYVSGDPHPWIYGTGLQDTGRWKCFLDDMAAAASGVLLDLFPDL